MNIDDIIRMAREAGLRRFGPLNIDPEIERFAALVAVAEREACIEWLRNNYQDYTSISEICEAIRARGRHEHTTRSITAG